MNQRTSRTRLRATRFGAAMMLLMAAVAPAWGRDDGLTTGPTTAPSHPTSLLEQLSIETQSLYQNVRPGLVRVELPPPKWVAQLSDAETLMQKWGGRLDPDVQVQLRDVQARAAAGHASPVQAYVASSQPAPSTQPQNNSSQNNSSQNNSSQNNSSQNNSSQNNPGQPRDVRSVRTLIVPRPDGGFEFITTGAQPYDADVGGMLVPRILGVVLDDAGHVLIPVFVEKEALEDRPVTVIGPEGKPVVGRFVGSDRQTNLTVLKLDHPVGQPVKLAGARPIDGSLVMLLSPNGESGHLSIWTGGQQDRGLVLSMDGQLNGFVRFGQFLSGDATRPLADEIIQYGRIRRATLGVLVSQAETPNGHHAVRVERVMENSAASTAGLHDGDFILSFAGAPVGDLPSFAAAIAERDGPTDIQVLRDGQPVTVTANLQPK